MKNLTNQIKKLKWYSYKECVKIARILSEKINEKVTGRSLLDKGTNGLCNGAYGSNILNKIEMYY